MFAPGGWRSVMSRWTAAGGKERSAEMDGLATLSRHFTTIAYDRRESGLSGGRVEPLSWDLYVGKRRRSRSRRRKAGGRARLCMGASLALAFAARHPQACRGLLLHWPVGGYLWMKKGHRFFQRHMEFVRANGLAAVVARAPKGENFWMDPEIGPWGSPAAIYPEFAAELVRHGRRRYLASARKAATRSSTTRCPPGRAAKSSAHGHSGVHHVGSGHLGTPFPRRGR